MAIKGLTHRPPRPEIIGRLYKGAEMVESGNRTMPGRDLGNALRFSSDDADIEAAFIAAFGSLTVSEPIPCLLAGATIDDAWQTERAVWGQTGLVRACDGEHMLAWRNADGFVERGQQPCMAPQCYAQKAKQEDGTYKDEWQTCPASGRLDLVLPALTDAGFYGVVRLSTHGEIDIRTIDATLRRLTVLPWRNVVDDHGGLFNVPWTISRVEEEISYVQKGTKRTRQLGVVTLKLATTGVPALTSAHGSPQLMVDEDSEIPGEFVENVTGWIEEGPVSQDDIVDRMMAQDIRIGELSNLIHTAREQGWSAAMTLGSDLLVAAIEKVVDKVKAPDTCTLLLTSLESALEGTPGLDDLKNKLTQLRGALALDAL